MTATAAIKTTMGWTEWVMLVTLSILWGGSFFFAGYLVSVMPPLTIVALRVLLAAATLWAVIIILRLSFPRSFTVWRAFLAMGILNNAIPFTLIVWGQTAIASGLAAILNATTPLFTILVAAALLPDERLTRLKVIGIVLGLAGVAVMVGPSFLGTIGGHPLAELAILGAALSYAFAGVYGRRFQRLGVEPMSAAAGQLTGSTLVLVPIALLIDRPFSLPVPGPAAWFSVVGLAVLSTALAYILYFRLLAAAGATNLLLVTILIPFSAIILGAAFLGETLAPLHFAGMAMIGAGLLTIDGRLFSRQSP